MKKFFFSLFLNILVIIASVGMFNGVKLPMDPLYWSIAVFSMSLGMLLHQPLLKFLTVTNNLVTYLVSVFLILSGVIMLLSSVLTGFFVNASSVHGIDFGVLSIAPMKLSALGTTLCYAFAVSLISSIMETLKKGGE